ncbi:MAG TPA: hypothetical protein VKQ52_14330 [Puia sp.]|nr:hypothetical protein [Puia sp.]
MCKLGLVLLFSFLVGHSYAQDYFVLLQSDNRQPFYVRMGGQLYTSSPDGHLILSQLKDSTYTINVGFPGHAGYRPTGQSGTSQASPGSPADLEQIYTFTTAQKDREFQIKEHGGAGWGLYDLQTNDWLAVQGRSGGREEVRAIGIRRDDAFSRMMAGVVQDTAVLYNDYANPNLAADSPANPALASTLPANTTPATRATTTVPGATAPTTTATITSPGATASQDSIIATNIPLINKPLTDTSATVATTADTANTRLFRPRPDSAVATNTKADTPAGRSVADSPNTAMAKPASDTPAIVKSAAPITKSTPDTPATHTTATTADSATASAPLYRPVAGTASHRSAPVVDSASGHPLYRPLPEVVKLSEKKGTRNMRLVYADKGRNARPDTVVVIIPLDTPQTATAKPRGPNPDSSRLAATRARAQNPDSSRSSSGRGHDPNSDTPTVGQGSTAVHLIIPTPVNPPADKTRGVDSPKKTTKTALPYVNSDCHNFATDYDVDKLRVKMLESTRDEERVAAALKVFKTKCFFTRQVRALSEVFTTDAAKYRFFETAYPFAADEHFRDLGTLLSDPVYAGKFKTLTGTH